MTNFSDYFPGGSAYVQIQTQYGQAAADEAYQAAQTGDVATLNATLSDIATGDTNADYSLGTDPSVNGQLNPALGSTSTASNFISNFGASLKSLLGNSLATVVLVAGLAFGLWLIFQFEKGE